MVQCLFDILNYYCLMEFAVDLACYVCSLANFLFRKSGLTFRPILRVKATQQNFGFTENFLQIIMAKILIRAPSFDKKR